MQSGRRREYSKAGGRRLHISSADMSDFRCGVGVRELQAGNSTYHQAGSDGEGVTSRKLYRGVLSYSEHGYIGRKKIDTLKRELHQEEIEI